MTDRRRSSKKQTFKTLQQPAVIFPSAVRGVCMYARPKTKLVAFLMCVCIFEKTKTSTKSLHTCAPHTAIYDGVRQNHGRKYAMVKRINKATKSTLPKGKPAKNVGNHVNSVHLEEKCMKSNTEKKSPEAISNSPGSEREVVKLLFKKLSKNRDKLLGVANSNDNTKENRRKPIHTDVARGVITIIKQYFCRQKYDQR